MKKTEILKQQENPLFKRKEIVVSVEADISPKVSEAEEFIAKEFSTTLENIKIKKIDGRFGSHNFIITANIYPSKEEKDKTESKQKKVKKEEKK